MNREIWRVVPSAPFFLASSEGRFMVIPSIRDMPGGGKRHTGGLPRFGMWEKKQGRFVTNYRGKTYKVHRLVCEAFHGHPPEDEPFCLHLDENAANNKPSNLKWGSQKENLNAPGFLEYCKARTGDDSPRAKWYATRLANMETF